MDYSYKILIELERLEQFSNVYQSELRFLSKKIRQNQERGSFTLQFSDGV